MVAVQEHGCPGGLRKISLVDPIKHLRITIWNMDLNKHCGQAALSALLFSLALCSCLENEIKPPANLPAPQPVAEEAPSDTLLTFDTAGYQLRIDSLGSGDSSGKWQNVGEPFPLAGAILPFKRVIAYYGNFYSKRMGILGELPEDEMLAKLQTEVQKWEQADTLTPVMPAIHYIAVTAQRDPGKGNKYRQRMPFDQIEKALSIAKKIDAIVILDIQTGWSTLQEELPRLDTFLAMPNVHLGIDPEFSMKTGAKPGKKIGSFDAADVNFAIGHLSELVKSNKLPPKFLVIHRFTKPMLTNYQDIKPTPEVQVVVQMDGWGGKAKKKGTYKQVIYPEPVQFAGFKIFYKHDTRSANGAAELQPEEVLQLVPKPIYIQYQ